MKARIQTFILLFFAVFFSVPAFTAERDKVYVIPVESEIDLGMAHHFKKALAESKEFGANLIVLKLNTFGGALDAADSIRTSLLKTVTPTVAFVDVNAASAGALIALACDSVYMAPGASMGSATVVDGSGTPMPEKYQSYMSTIMMATAEHHGKKAVGDSLEWRRDPTIAKSMVNPDVSVSMTGRQAVECGYADGIAPDLNAVLADLDMSGSEIRYYESTVSDDILGFLSNAAVRAVLIMLILGGIYMEMHTPGFGFAGAVAAIAAILYFLPMMIVGSVPAWSLILFIAGVILIAMEIFVIPGFGICGTAGIIAIVISMVGSMMGGDTVTGFDLGGIVTPIIVVGCGTVMAVALVAWLTSSKGPRCVRRHSELMTELRTTDGFIGVDMEPKKLIGHHGKTLTEMRPAGKIEVDGQIYDAVSTGNFIPSERKVKILKYENAQLYVCEIH